VDDSDLEVNEARLDWVHTKAHAATADELTAEIEKGFGLLTVEAELHYERDVDSGNVSDGIGNIDLGARYPFYQYVSDNGFIDTTLGAEVEAGIPVHSTVSKNAEFVPKVFNDLRLGQHFTVQAIAGYSTLFGPGEDGGAQTLEYGFDFGYSITREQLHIPHVQQLIPLFELSGETAMNHGESGRTSLTGLAGFRASASDLPSPSTTTPATMSTGASPQVSCLNIETIGGTYRHAHHSETFSAPDSRPRHGRLSIR
jgi:hypothetical protein